MLIVQQVVYVWTYGDGVSVYNETSWTNYRRNTTDNAMQSGDVRCVYVDSFGILYAGDLRRLHERVRRDKPDAADYFRRAWESNRVGSLYVDGAGILDHLIAMIGSLIPSVIEHY